MLTKAIEFARTRHAGQYRKFKGEAYFNHPHRVAQIVFREKRSSELDALVAAALLHDIVEDTNTKVSEINQHFGELVASLVEELTTDKDECNRLGKAQYLSEKMSRMSSWGLIIKLADRLDNLSDLEHATKEFRLKYMTETRTILDTIIVHRSLSQTHGRLIMQINNRLQQLEMFNLTATY